VFLLIATQNTAKSDFLEVTGPLAFDRPGRCAHVLCTVSYIDDMKVEYKV
jgi:hypothetical protein